MSNKKKADGIKKGLIVSLIGAVLLMSIFALIPTGKAAGLGSVTDTLGDYQVGQTTWHNISFTTATTGTIKYVNITFPSMFDISGTGNPSAVTGLSAGTGADSGQNYTYTVTSALEVPTSTVCTINISSIATAATQTVSSGLYRVTVHTLNVIYETIDEPTNSAYFRITGALTSVADTLGDPKGGATTWHNVSFTTATTGDIQYVNITFPGGFNVAGATLAGVQSLGAGSLSVSGQVVTYILTTADPTDIGTACAVNMSGIVNNNTGANYVVAVETFLTGYETIDGPTTGTFAIIGNLVNVVDTLGDYNTGVNTWHNVSFITSTTGVIDNINITFPDGFDLTGVTNTSLVITGLGTDDTGTIWILGQTARLNVTNPMIINAGNVSTINISGIVSPSVTVPTNYNVTVQTFKAPAYTSVDGPTDSATFQITTLRDVTDTLGVYTESDATWNKIQFTTATTAYIKYVNITFPAGFDVSGATYTAGNCSGIGEGTILYPGQYINYTVTTAVSVPSGTVCWIKFDSIVSPPIANPTEYNVSVFTQRADYSIIDGPAYSANFTINNHLTAVTDKLGNYQVGQTTWHNISFTTATAETIKWINITFPTGFNIAGATLTATTGLTPVFNASNESISKSGQTITYTNISALSISSGTACTINVSGIISPSAGGWYNVTVATRTSTYGIIDGPTKSANFRITGVLTAVAVTLGDSNTLATTWHNITFTAALTGTIQYVNITYPTGFDLTGVTNTSLAITGLGTNNAGTIWIAGQVASLLVTNPMTINAGNVSTINISGIVNGAKGVHTINVTTMETGYADIDSGSATLTITSLTVTDTLGSYLAHETTWHLVSFTTAKAGVIKDVNITFPDGFDITGVNNATVTVTGLVNNGSVSNVGTIWIAGQKATWNVTNATVSTAANTVCTINISGIVNYNPGTYNVTVVTLGAGYAAIDGPENSADFTITSLTEVTDTLEIYRVGYIGWHNISFKTARTGVIDNINITFPAGFDVATPTLGVYTGISVGTLLVSVQTIRYNVTTPESIAAGTTITINISGIKNPLAGLYVAGFYNVTVATFKAPAYTPVDGPTVSANFIITGNLSWVGDTLGDYRENATTYHNISFNTTTNGTIKYINITFPDGFDISGAGLNTTTGLSTNASTQNILPISGQVITYTNVTAMYVTGGTNCSINLTGIKNYYPGTYNVSVVTMNASYAVIDENVSADFTILSIGVYATPGNYKVGATTWYNISFTTVGGKIDNVNITFPSGFNVASPTLGVVTGISAGTISISGQIVRYNVTVPAVIDAGTITINISGIVNHKEASQTAAGNDQTDVKGDYYLIVETYAAPGWTIVDTARDSMPFTLVPDIFAHLQILIQGEEADPGNTTSGGKQGSPITVYAGEAFNVTVNAVDQYWNVRTGDTPTVYFTSATDPLVEKPANTTLVAGTYVFPDGVTLKTKGTENTVSVSIAGLGSATDTSSYITVNPNLAPNPTTMDGNATVVGLYYDPATGVNWTQGTSVRVSCELVRNVSNISETPGVYDTIRYDFKCVNKTGGGETKWVNGSLTNYTTFDNLVNGTEYEYYAAGNDTYGNVGTWSVVTINITQDAVSPAQIQIIAPLVTTYTKGRNITVYWNASTDSGSGLAYYLVEADPGASFEGAIWVKVKSDGTNETNATLSAWNSSVGAVSIQASYAGRSCKFINLQDGCRYEFNVYAVDNVSNKGTCLGSNLSTIDATKPVTNVTNPTTNIYPTPFAAGCNITKDATFTFTITDSLPAETYLSGVYTSPSGVRYIKWKVINSTGYDFGYITNYSNPFSLDFAGVDAAYSTTLPSGEYTLWYYAEDNASKPAEGNTETPKTIVVWLDITPPVTTISADIAWTPPLANGGNVSSDTVFTLTANDKPAAHNCSVAFVWYTINSTYYTYVAPFSISEQGWYTITWGAQDNLNNNETGNSWTVWVDDSDPTVNITIGTPNWPDNTVVNISDPSAAIVYNVTNATTFWVNATADNPDHNAGVNKTWYQVGTRYFEELDNSSSFTFAALGLNATTGWIGDGEYIIYYGAADNVSNNASFSITIYLDNTGPTTTELSFIDQQNPWQDPVTGDWYVQGLNNTLTFAGTDGAGSGVYQFNLQCGNDSTFGEATNPRNIYVIYPNNTGNDTGLENGKKYYYRGRAQDNLGNWGTWYGIINVTQDNSAPVTTIAIGTPNWPSATSGCNVTSATEFNLTAVDYPTNNSGVDYTMYKIVNSTGVVVKDWTLYTGNFTFNGLAISGDENYTIYYYSVDRVNNTETEKNITVYLDNTVPTLTVVVGPPVDSDWNVTNGTIYVNVTVTDAGSGVRNVSLYWRYYNGTTYTNWAQYGVTQIAANLTQGFYNWTGFTFNYSDGNYEFNITAYDNLTLENVVLRSRGLDTTKPVSSVLAITPYWYNGDATIYVNESATNDTNLTGGESGIADVSLWYRYSPNNATPWGGWVLFGNTTGTSWTFNFANATGFYEFYSRAWDVAGNYEDDPLVNDTGAIAGFDIVKPTVNVTKDPTGPNGDNDWYVTSVNVTGSGADAHSGVASVEWVKINIITGLEVGSGTGATITLDDGKWNIKFRATDNAGNVGNWSESGTIKIDKVAPVANEIVLALGAVWTATVDVSSYVNITEVTSGLFAWNVSYDNWATYTIYNTPSPTLTLTLPSGEGDKQVWVKVMDAAGWESNAVTDTIYLDVTKPTAAHTTEPTVPATGYYTTDVWVNITGSDIPGSGVKEIHWIIIKNGIEQAENFASGSSGSVLLTAEGTYQVRYWAVDNMSWEGTKKITEVIIIDKVAPTVTITLSPVVPDGNNNWYKSAVTVTIEATDLGSGVKTVEYSYDNVNWNSYPGAFSVSDEGSYTIYARATDNANRIGSATPVTFKIDRIAPTTTPSTVPTGWSTSDVTLTLTTGADTSGIATGYPKYKVTFNGVAEAWKSYSTTLTFSADGTYVVEFYSKDNAGNTEDINSVLFKIDKTIPTISTTLPTTLQSTAEVTISAVILDATSGIDTGTIVLKIGTTTILATAYSYNPATGQLTYITTLTDATYTVTIDVKDKAGSATQASWSFTVDVTPPTGTVKINVDAEGVPAVYTTNEAVTLTLNYSADAVTMGFSNDGASYTSAETCNATKTWELTAGDGTKTVYVKFRDAAGKEYVATDTIILDKTKPTPSIIVTPSKAMIYKGETLQFSGAGSSDTNGIASYAWNIDGVAYTGVSMSHKFTAKGTYTVTLTVTDNAGLSESATVTITVKDKPQPPPFIPGFEVLALIAAMGVAVVLLRKKKH